MLFSETQATIENSVELSEFCPELNRELVVRLESASANQGLVVINKNNKKLKICPSSIKFTEDGFIKVNGVIGLESVLFALNYLGITNATIRANDDRLPFGSGKVDDCIFTIHTGGIMLQESGFKPLLAETLKGSFVDSEKCSDDFIINIKPINNFDDSFKISFNNNRFLDEVITVDCFNYEELFNSYKQYCSLSCLHFLAIVSVFSCHVCGDFSISYAKPVDYFNDLVKIL